MPEVSGRADGDQGRVAGELRWCEASDSAACKVVCEEVEDVLQGDAVHLVKVGGHCVAEPRVEEVENVLNSSSAELIEVGLAAGGGVACGAAGGGGALEGAGAGGGIGDGAGRAGAARAGERGRG